MTREETISEFEARAQELLDMADNVRWAGQLDWTRADMLDVLQDLQGALEDVRDMVPNLPVSGPDKVITFED